MEYHIEKISPDDKVKSAQMDNLLISEGIRRDNSLTYSCGIFDDEGNIAATGSLFGNTLRCLAVSSLHQGENLMSVIVTHLTEIQMEKGITHLFLYTKPEAAKKLAQLGYYEISRVKDKLVFMENRRTGFSDYLKKIEKTAFDDGSSCAAIVMNANPFTKGHQYLVETAAKGCSKLLVMVVSEDKSQFSFSDRFAMVKMGCSRFGNVGVIESGEYIISSATFPSYFIKENDDVTKIHAELDANIFAQIAKAANITKRYVGDEPFSHSTSIYNNALSEILPCHGVEVEIINRLQQQGTPISASRVRSLIYQGNYEAVKQLVPEETFEYLTKCHYRG